MGVMQNIHMVLHNVQAFWQINFWNYIIITQCTNWHIIQLACACSCGHTCFMPPNLGQFPSNQNCLDFIKENMKKYFQSCYSELCVNPIFTRACVAIHLWLTSKWLMYLHKFASFQACKRVKTCNESYLEECHLVILYAGIQFVMYFISTVCDIKLTHLPLVQHIRVIVMGQHWSR